MVQATHRGAGNNIKTGDKEVDDVNDQAFGPDAPKTPLQKLYDDAISGGYWFEATRALRSAITHGGEVRGYEGEVNAEMAKTMGRKAKGFWVPYDAPIRLRRNLTVPTGAGSVTAQIPYMLMIDVLRPKLAIARLGGRILNINGDGPAGNVQIPSKSAASTVSWVAEGAAAPAESNPTIPGFTLVPHTSSAYTDLTRRMWKLGGPEIEDHAIDDIFTGIAVSVDAAALNGLGSGGQPLGLFQFPGTPAISAHGDVGNGGTITYSNLVAMNQIVGLYNADAPMGARMGWVTSPQGKATLLLTDKSASASTGRYCWETHAKLVDGELFTVDTVLGFPAISTTNAPSASTEGDAVNITSLAHGNFADCVVNLFSGFDCLVNPFLQSVSGVLRISGFQDVDVRFLHGGAAFCVCSNIAPIVPQTS